MTYPIRIPIDPQKHSEEELYIQLVATIKNIAAILNTNIDPEDQTKIAEYIKEWWFEFTDTKAEIDEQIFSLIDHHISSYHSQQT